MKPACYLLRFDDVCPTMDWHIWKQVEALLSAFDVRPMLAVVPSNRDPQLEVMPALADFWQRVRDWQGRGWSIAMHGFEHRYETRDSGLVGINAYSEFAGLPREEQRRKLEAACAIFAERDVAIDAWIAPAHSFDAITLELLRGLGIAIVSDGFYWRPVRRLGLTWVPQQLWRFRAMPAGVWTVCYHANRFAPRDIERLRDDIARFRERIVSLDDLLAGPVAPESLLDRAFERAWRASLRMKRALAA